MVSEDQGGVTLIWKEELMVVGHTSCSHAATCGNWMPGWPAHGEAPCGLTGSFWASSGEAPI